ncbi:MAG TPA: UDPGP type 1 family protein [Caulifigura sp.]|jgi:UDP-N-acetylglucosamine/UDP-N-acetylgalactosamine diphosphorylase|nr:UDPGP type 1 family protein [Caulifigura sp.]
MEIPPSLQQRVAAAGQQHLFQFWNELDEPQQRALLRDVEGIDFDRLQRLLHARADLHASGAAAGDRVERAESPSQLVRQPKSDADREAWASAAATGRDLLAQGKVGALLVAGGQGTRLGFDQPKGMFPVGPISGKSLYQWFAEQLRCRGAEARRSIPYFMMTSEATHNDTLGDFKANNFFGLVKEDVFMFQQGLLPAIAADSDRILLDEKFRVSLSPDGHGGLLHALSMHGLLEEMTRRGLEYLYYHQVDNPTAIVCDPAFIGWHVQQQSEVSTKVVKKVSPDERMGVVCSVDGKTEIIEYSDLTPEQCRKKDAGGNDIFWAGSTAMHVFSVSFLMRLVEEDIDLPYHIAKKAVPFVDESGNRVTPTSPNATKFEQFVFDTLPLAANALVVEADRAAEFNPVKNKEGADSPATTRAALIANHRRWAERAGATVKPGVTVEISPLLACDEEAAVKAIALGTVIDRDTVLE